MNWGFVTYSSLIARFEGLVQFISLKRTTIRNPATRSTAKLFTIRGRSRSKAGQIAFVPGSINNFGPTIRTTTRTSTRKARESRKANRRSPFWQGALVEYVGPGLKVALLDLVPG